MRAIHDYNGFAAAAAALKLAPLVLARSGELSTAEWSEFDLDAVEWRIPASKMKMQVEHLARLSAQAVAISCGSRTPLTSGGRYVPSLRAKNACMSSRTPGSILGRHNSYRWVSFRSAPTRVAVAFNLDVVVDVDFDSSEVRHLVALRRQQQRQ